MTRQFDATPKGLLEIGPADWPAFLGVPARSVEVKDADVSTVTGATDKVLLIRSDKGDRIQHYDFQSGPDASVPQRAHKYNAVLGDRHELPVESVVVLLARKANLRAINGLYERRLPGETKPYLRFRYRILRVWELPVETVLRAGISVLPLAPLCAVQRKDLPGVVARMKQRLDAEPDQARVEELWTATRLLLGLRYDEVFVDRLLQRVRAMKESSTYQAIVREGRIEEARKNVQQLGEEKFEQAPPAQIQTTLESLTDLDQLERLLKRILNVETWEELLAQAPAPSATAQGKPAKLASPRRRRNKS
jgi:hypothetical protein